MTEIRHTVNCSRDTQIGVLPANWEVVPLDQAVSRESDTLDPQDDPEERFDYYSIPSYQQSEDPALETGGSIRSRKLVVHRGMVLFGRLNPRVPKIWRVVSQSQRRKIASTEFIALIPRDDHTTQDFLYYLLWSNFVLPKSQELVSGSTPSRQRTDIRAFLKIPIPLPPFPEQRRIAAALRTIQDAIAAQDDVIAAARELKRSLMQRLFTYGPGREPAPTRETDFGAVPIHWDTISLDECAYVQTGVAKGRKLDDQKTVVVPYLRVANVQDGFLDLAEIKTIRIRSSELDRYRLEQGDVVLTEGGDFDKLGRGFIWEDQIPGCIHQNHIFAVRTHHNVLLPEYLAYLVQSGYGKAYFLSVAHRTTNLACINKTKLSAFPTLIPELEVQERISELLLVADAKIAAEEQRKAALEELVRSALEQLMTGQIRLPA